MRRRHFSPTFDSLSLRITPSSTKLTTAVLAASPPIQTTQPYAMPGERTTLSSWDLDSSTGPIDLDQPSADPSVWS